MKETQTSHLGHGKSKLELCPSGVETDLWRSRFVAEVHKNSFLVSLLFSGSNSFIN